MKRPKEAVSPENKTYSFFNISFNFALVTASIGSTLGWFIGSIFGHTIFPKMVARRAKYAAINTVSTLSYGFFPADGIVARYVGMASGNIASASALNAGARHIPPITAAIGAFMLPAAIKLMQITYNAVKIRLTNGKSSSQNTTSNRSKNTTLKPKTNSLLFRGLIEQKNQNNNNLDACNDPKLIQI